MSVKPFGVNLLLMTIVLSYANVNLAYIGGQLAKAGEYPSVVWIEYGCTGSLIANDKILVAGHCITTHNSDNRHFKGQIIKLYTQPIALGSTPLSVTVKKVFVHPDWSVPIENGVDYITLLNDDSVADAAIIQVSPPVSPSSTLKIANLSYNKLKKGKEKSESDVVTVGGYGCEAVQTPARDPKYKVANKQISSNKGKYFFVPERDYDAETTSMGCEGDSGGPAFVKTKVGQLEQIGLNSRVTGDEAGGRMRVLYLFSIKDWLAKFGL
jgi:secreted trypsin-like serine protease